MPIPSLITDLAITAALNSPAGGESVTTTDDYLRAQASFIAQLRDNTGFTTSPRAASGANTDITSLGSLASINGGQLAGMRSRIINGNFLINQRGVAGTVTLAAGVYGHDRFKAGSGGCTYTFATVQNLTTLTITAGTLQQVIEGISLDSGTFVLSWVGTTTGRIDGGVYGATGITGTAVGGTNQTVEFGTGTVSKVQYERGTVTTPFENRPVGMELALCQRYCEPMGIIRLEGYGNGSNVFNAFKPFKVTKRTSPTLSGQSVLSNINCSIGAGTTDIFEATFPITVNATGAFVAQIGGTVASAEL